MRLWSVTRVRLVVWMLALVEAGNALLGTAALAQTQSSGTLLDALRELQGTRDSNRDLPSLETGPATWSLERAVDPTSYRLTPGDGVNVGVWGNATNTWSLRVTPEGELILPTIGPIQVGEATLAEAESLVRAALGPLYPRSRVTLRLIEPGRFRVSVAGLVARPGVYEATRADRLSMALIAAGGIRAGASVRQIRLVPVTPEAGTERTVDLFPWLLRGDLAANPVLAPGFAIEVPLRGPTVRVRGPVQGRTGLELTPERTTRIGDRPDEEADLVIEWREGDDLSTLLAAAGGLSDRATRRARLSREGESPRLLDLDAPADLALALRPNDLVDIDYLTRWVYVTGAVRQPGRYPYLSGLRALDYVSLAGGPSELGRATGWTVRADDGEPRSLDPLRELAAGEIMRVPERKSYKLQTWLAPLSSATAVVLSIIAIARR